jgi:hypothetical protein
VRTPLKNRRHGLTIPVEHRHQTFDCTFSFNEAGECKECFMRSTKEGNDFSALMVDSAIILSMLLQHGLSMADMVRALGEDSAGGAQSALGAIARAGAALDQRSKMVREALE